MALASFKDNAANFPSPLAIPTNALRFLSLEYLLQDSVKTIDDVSRAVARALSPRYGGYFGCRRVRRIFAMNLEVDNARKTAIKAVMR